MADYLCPYCHALYRDAQNHCPADGSMLIEVPQVDDLSGQVLRRKYKLERSLGQGGFGSVYRATHLVLGKTVAVKVLRNEFRQDATMVARFFNEARVVTRLTNPHTIQTFDLDQTEDGLLFMVMEYVSGRTLRELAQQEGEPGGRLPWRRALGLLMQVCDSLEEAHGQSVIHRDLKPDNIMVSNRGGEVDFATVLDFGIAKVLEGANNGLTAAGSLIGSPAYMSPEQILGRPLDARSDLYSLGAVAYQVLSGALPVNARQTAAILQEKVLLPPTPMSVKLPGLSIPPELDDLVVALLATKPEDRPGSAIQLKEAMGAMLGTSGVGSVPSLDSRPVPVPEVAVPAAGTVAYGAAVGAVPVSKVVVAVDADVDQTVDLQTANAGGANKVGAGAGFAAGGVAASAPQTAAKGTITDSAVMETLQATAPMGVLAEARPWYKQKGVAFGALAVLLVAVTAAVLVFRPSAPSDQAATQAATVKDEPAAPKAVARPEETKRPHTKKSETREPRVPEVKPATNVEEEAGGAVAPQGTPSQGDQPLQKGEGATAPVQKNSEPIQVVPGKESPVPPEQNPIQVVPSTPKGDDAQKGAANPKSQLPKAAAPKGSTPASPKTPGQVVSPQSPVPVQPVAPEAPKATEPKVPATPASPIQPTTESGGSGSNGKGKTGNKRPRNSTWSDPEMEHMEDEMKQELKKSLEMWQLGPDGEGGVNVD